MRLWFPIPRLITSFCFRRDAPISQFVNGSFWIAVALMVMAAEADFSLSVRGTDFDAASDERYSLRENETRQ